MMPPPRRNISWIFFYLLYGFFLGSCQLNNADTSINLFFIIVDTFNLLEDLYPANIVFCVFWMIASIYVC